MQVSKIKVGKTVNYTTPRGTTGRGRVESIEQKPSGPWIVVSDKANKKTVSLRPGCLS